MTNDVRVELDGHVAILHLVDLPEGVMTAGLVRSLSEAVDALERERLPRVIMFTGTTPGLFVRRYDIGELFAPAGSEAAEGRELLPRFIRRLERLDAITVAALNGTALGGGFELALGCDFRLASDGPYRFGFRETDVGLTPGAGGTQRLARLVGVARALELVMLSRLLKPQEALALGLLTQVYDPESFPAASRRFCQSLAQRAPVALIQAKHAIRRGVELPLDEGLALERRAFEICSSTEDAREAVKAYGAGANYAFRGV